ncbi:MAG: hypothetical protein IRZ18_08405 [Clostridia bacterium]|nr:hypothetical protein [Clostridia bacterium]
MIVETVRHARDVDADFRARPFRASVAVTQDGVTLGLVSPGEALTIRLDPAQAHDLLARLELWVRRAPRAQRRVRRMLSQA